MWNKNFIEQVVFFLVCEHLADLIGHLNKSICSFEVLLVN